MSSEESNVMADDIETLIETSFVGMSNGITACIERCSSSINSSFNLLAMQAEALESALVHIQDKEAALRIQMQTKIRNIYKQRNTQVSLIYRVPEEIFANILFHVIDLSESGIRNEVRYQLSSVAWRWFEAVKANPVLWSFIRGEDGLKNVQYLINRSKNSSLDIRYDAIMASESEADEFFKLALQCVLRWRAFKISGLGTPLKQWYFPQVAVPFLERFTISSWRHGGLQVENLFDGQAPRLRVFGVIPHILPWNSPILLGLHDIRIMDGEGDASERNMRYHRLFRSSPLLEQVVIKQKRRPGDESSHSYSEPEPIETKKMESIFLPRLTSIQLIDISAHTAATVLSFLTPLPGHHSYIRANFFLSEPWIMDILLRLPSETLIPSIIPFFTKFEICALQSESRSRTYLIIHGRLSCEDMTPTRSEYPGLYLEFNSPFPPSLSTFATRMITPSITRLVIHGYPDVELCTSEFTERISLLTRLEELTIRGYRDEASTHLIFTVLQHPLSNEFGGEKRWPCPGLRKLLMIRVKFRMERLLDMVKTRYPLEPEAKESSGGPGPLEKLEIWKEHLGEDDSDSIEKVETIIKGQGGTFRLSACY